MQTTTSVNSSNPYKGLIAARASKVSAVDFIEHRLEPVAELSGVLYLNDAKATDPNSTLYSFSKLTEPVIWISYQPLDESGFESYNDEIADKLKAALVITHSVDPALELACEKVIAVKSLNAAVALASRISAEGDTVLFSPSTNNPELMLDYMDEGERYRELVKRLK